MEDCIFCKIANGEIPTDLVYEGERVVGFRDINPQAPTHILLIPKAHIESKGNLTEEQARIASDIFLAAQEVARNEKIAEGGWRLILNTGQDAGQEIAHMHFHLLGGKNLGPMLAKSSEE